MNVSCCICYHGTKAALISQSNSRQAETHSFEAESKFSEKIQSPENSIIRFPIFQSQTLTCGRGNIFDKNAQKNSLNA